MARTTITRTGRQRIALTAASVQVADVLADPAAVTVMLGDLLDQKHSVAAPHPRWVLPSIGLGSRSLRVAVLPTFARIGDDVDIDAVSTSDSDARVHLTMNLRPEPHARGTQLTTLWQVVLGIPVGRTMAVLLTPAIDLSVTRIVDEVMNRTARAVG